MKKIFMAGVMGALMVASTWASGQQGDSKSLQHIQWMTSFEDAMKQAGMESKPILLDFFNPN